MKVYHLSPIRNRESIRKHGLQPKSYQGKFIRYSPRIFVSTSLKDLAFDYVNYENVDVWEFEVSQERLTWDSVSKSPHHFYLIIPIAAEKLRLFRSVVYEPVYKKWFLKKTGLIVSSSP